MVDVLFVIIVGDIKVEECILKDGVFNFYFDFWEFFNGMCNFKFLFVNCILNW